VRIAFVAVAETPAAMLATQWARRLHDVIGQDVEIVPAAVGGLAAALDGLSVDATVVFIDDAPATERLRVRADIVVRCGIDDGEAAPTAGGTCRNLARGPEQLERLRLRGANVWHRAWEELAGPDELSLPVLVQPLSHVLAKPAMARPAQMRTEYPVWTYWEGPMPDWIAGCLETVRRHAPSLRVLGPAEFDALRDRDRDLNLSKLHVAQRSDFIRSFLLMRFGGFWIDADCIVMRDLSPIVSQLGAVEVIAHRERQGYFSNAFFGAKIRAPAK
jgi:hypothetical protein